MREHKFPYRWTLAEAKFTKDKGKVFSCFACGGGSTMGYKLAGYDVIGCNEIDQRMNRVYIENHHPKYNYLCDIRELVKKAQARELPEELYNLDVLDGSPPCSSFSIAGNREKDWGKEKHFREGQTKQVLDTLFFDFIDLARELQPKVIIAENVKGLIMDEARKYVANIFNDLDEAGYYTTLTLCNAATMGVPQKRERVFFVAVKKELAEDLPKVGLFGEPSLDLTFDESPVLFGEIMETGSTENQLTEFKRRLWDARQPGDIDLGAARLRLDGRENMNFNDKLIYRDKVANTVASKDLCTLYDEPRYRSARETILCSTFPLDYKFGKESESYICGMSVPPVMMAQVASRVYEQWLTKIK